MDGPPSNTQRPRSFHPDFDREVFMIVFSVEGQGFKVDATRLTAHSNFLREMLFDSNGLIGTTREGTVDNPINVHGCSVQTFANFLGWLNHNSWAPHQTEHSQQLLDILHVSHMWDIQPGIDFASQELLKFDLHPAHRLSLAHRYNLLDWISAPVRSLLTSPLERYTLDTKAENKLDFNLYMIIATTKELISTERKRLGNHPPFPLNFDNEPFCTHHVACKKVWTEKWFFTIVRRIHHPITPLPLCLIPDVLEEIDHHGMNAICKRSIISWLRDSCIQVQKEENIIQETIATVHNLFV